MTKRIQVDLDKINELINNLRQAIKRNDTKTIIEQTETADLIDWTGFEDKKKDFENLLSN